MQHASQTACSQNTITAGASSQPSTLCPPRSHGQNGVPVYEKIHVDGNRLRHRPATLPAATAPSRCPDTSSAAPTPIDSHFSSLHVHSSATLVAYWRTATCPRPRADLPQGHRQRLNPADYDVGFHRDGLPWRLSRLTYCERLARLAAACNLSNVLTMCVHYASENDRSLHLICRAAGRDQPLSGYPDPVPGVRCLKSRAEVEALAAPLLKLIGVADGSGGCLRPEGCMQMRCIAMDIAESGGWKMRRVTLPQSCDSTV